MSDYVKTMTPLTQVFGQFCAFVGKDRIQASLDRIAAKISKDTPSRADQVPEMVGSDDDVDAVVVRVMLSFGLMDIRSFVDKTVLG